MVQLTLAPETSIKFYNGKLVVHGPFKDNPFITASPFIIFTLQEFHQPKDFDDSSEPADPKALSEYRLIKKLWDLGVLIESEHHPDHGELKGVAGEREAALVQAQLSRMANLLYQLSSDFAALGPPAHQSAHPEAPQPSQQLQTALEDLTAMHGRLIAMRAGFMERQLAQINYSPDDTHLKLHVGSGPNLLKSWINIDIGFGDVQMDINWGLPFADNSADYVFFSHMLEHLYYPGQALRVLQDMHRTLAPGGVLRIIVPDLEKCINAYYENDRSFFESRNQTWDWWDDAATRLEDFLNYAGAGPAPGQFFADHKFGYDYETLAHLLKKAGFGHIRKCDYMKSLHPALHVDYISKVAGATYDGNYYSLFVEATK